MVKNTRPIILVLALAAVVGAILYLQSQKPDRGGQDTIDIAVISKGEKAQKYEPAKEITTPDGFINTDDITISEFVGEKVVLVDFWTYSCINCQRTTPYLNAWYEKYKDKGFVIIGVHTPEFEFEKDYSNVQAAVEKFGIKFPVVLDNDYSTWTAYKNRYWPRKYLIDIDGYIIYDHIGEGSYEETEKKIQEALKEREAVLGMNSEIDGSVSTPQEVVDVDTSMPRSPEIYFGSARNSAFTNGRSGSSGIQNLSDPQDIETNNLYLVGNWDIQKEFSENKNSGAKIIFRYEAKNVYFVAGSKNDVTIKIFKDGKLVGEQIVNEHKLYHLIKDSEYGEHTLEILIEGPGVKAFTFTFG